MDEGKKPQYIIAIACWLLVITCGLHFSANNAFSLHKERDKFFSFNVGQALVCDP
jgi:hypothetical protein